MGFILNHYDNIIFLHHKLIHIMVILHIHNHYMGIIIIQYVFLI